MFTAAFYDRNRSQDFSSPVIEDPLSMQTRFSVLNKSNTENDMMRQKMGADKAEASLGEMRKQAYRDANGDPDAFRANLIRNGDHGYVAELDKQQQIATKSQSDLRGARIDQGEKLRNGHLSAINALINSPTAETFHGIWAEAERNGDEQGMSRLRTVAQWVDSGVPIPEIKKRLGDLGQSLMTEAERMPKYQDGTQINPNAPSGALATLPPSAYQSAQVKNMENDNKLGWANLGIAQKRLALEQSNGAGNGKAPAGWRYATNGDLEPIPGGPQDPANKQPKNLTEIQAKGQLFGRRAQESHSLLNSLEGKYSPMAVNAKMAVNEYPGVGGALGYLGNSMLSDAGQKAEQAQRDFINATLRVESGAVIAESEFKNAQKQYFPQPGDSRATIIQKRKNREKVIQGFKVMAGPAGNFDAAPAAASGGWNIRALP